MSRKQQVLAMGCVGLLALCAAGFAQEAAIPQAAPIPAEAAVKDDAVKPLTVKYYNFQKIRPMGTPGIDSMEIAGDFVAQHNEDATVTLPDGLINFPAGAFTVTPSGKTLGEYFFGAVEMEKRGTAAEDGTGEKIPDELKVQMSSRNIWVYKGFVRVEKEGTYTFRVPNDDAARLTIGGVVVHTSPEGGMYGVKDDRYRSHAEFVAPGIYPVEILHYDKAGGVGIKAFADVPPRGPAFDIGNAQELNLLKFMGGDDVHKTTLKGLTDDKRMKSGLPDKANEQKDQKAQKEKGWSGGGPGYDDASAAAAAEQPVRTWKSAQGGIIEASLLSRSGDDVVLQTKDGRKVKTQVQRLSEEDQKYLDGLKK